MRILLPAVILLAALPLGLSAFKEGPLPNMTGGFGDATCQQCHLDNAVNAPGGRLTVSGIPPAYLPGHVYPVTVRLEREGMRRGGFEIGARFASGDDRGRQAGEWRVTGDRAQLQASSDGSLQFAQHSMKGTLAATRGALTWTIDWIAPDHADSPVQFNTAANASNDDASPLGDYIYVDEQRSHGPGTEGRR